MTFYYRRGLVETQTKWHRPSPNRILKFLNRSVPVIESLGLELWLTGRAIIDPTSTWDLDCYIIGHLEDQANEDIQHALIDEGFRHGMLVDPYWISNHSRVYKQDHKWFQRPAQVLLIYPVEQMTSKGLKTIDFRGREGIPQRTKYLVEFAYGNQPLDAKHIPYLNQQGDFPRINAIDYPLTIDPTENTLNIA